MRGIGTGLLLSLLLAPAVASAACPPAGYDGVALQELKQREFAVPDAGERDRLAIALLDCLGDPDPALRDGIAYEALAHWMRRQELSVAALGTLRERLLPMLDAPDPQGFRPPFAALVLSEVARTDRIRPWMDGAQRAQLADAAARYLGNVRDYRGFIDGQGWRHGVAHSADLAMQLALNPAVELARLDQLLAAVAAQVAPAGTRAYIHGEPMRLARPVYFIAQRATHDAAFWSGWLRTVAAPAPLPDWNAAFASEAGLAKRHNVSGFLAALYLLVQEQDDAATRERLLPGLRAVLKEVP